jgi:Ni,Fe-hydrogenase III small subunit
MTNALYNILKPKVTEEVCFEDSEFEEMGLMLRERIDKVFARSLAVRALDTGSDNSPEMELVNLTSPHYDIERFGVSFVASPRHADVLAVTGAVTRNMEVAAKKTYDAMPHPKFVVAIGDDACDGGIFRDSYAVAGGADRVLPVDVRIPGNPPTPKDIMRGLLALMDRIEKQDQ